MAKGAECRGTLRSYVFSPGCDTDSEATIEHKAQALTKELQGFATFEHKLNPRAQAAGLLAGLAVFMMYNYV